MTPRKKPSTELAIPFPLVALIYRGELIDETTNAWKIEVDSIRGPEHSLYWVKNRERVIERLDRAVATVERLYPELHADSGRIKHHRFDPALIIAKTQAKTSRTRKERAGREG